MVAATDPPMPGLRWPGVRRVLVLGVGQLSVGALLFLAAGTLGWPRGWIFLAAWMGQMLGMRLVVAWKTPELLNVRGSRHAGTKDFDSKLLHLYYLLIYVFPVVAGLDHRYGWLPLPSATVFVGLACVLFAALMVGVFVTRTALEDRVLAQELEGYAAYARRTRGRLVPTVW